MSTAVAVTKVQLYTAKCVALCIIRIILYCVLIRPVLSADILYYYIIFVLYNIMYCVTLNLTRQFRRQLQEGSSRALSPHHLVLGTPSPRSMVATLYVWQYDGGEDGSPEAARRGEQRGYAGDLVIDDVLGQGKLVRIDGSDVIVEFGSGETLDILREFRTLLTGRHPRAERTQALRTAAVRLQSQGGGGRVRAYGCEVSVGVSVLVQS